MHRQRCRRAEDPGDANGVAGGGVARGHRAPRPCGGDGKNRQAKVRKAGVDEREELAEAGVAGEIDGARWSVDDEAEPERLPLVGEATR
jgi:hypothetical protein